MKPLNVALIIRTLLIGGAERHILKLAQTVDPACVSLRVFLLVNDVHHTLKSPVEQTGVPVFVSPYHKNDLRLLRWLGTGLNEQKIDVAHSFLWRSDATLSLVKLLFNYHPIVCSVRGGRSRAPTWKTLYDRLITFRYSDRICANSVFGSDLIARQGCPRHKIIVIHNGVDLDGVDQVEAVPLHRQYGLPHDCRLAGYVGRLVRHKGVETIIEAAHHLEVGGDSRIRFVILGDGPDRARLEARACELGVRHRLFFLGWRLRPIEVVRRFHVCLSTTIGTEHCSTSILEYMACRKPVIATDVGGNAELVAEGRTGLLVRPGDSAQLADAIRQILEVPGDAQRMGREGRARVEKEFRMETVAARFVDLWQAVSDPTSAGRAPT